MRVVVITPHHALVSWLIEESRVRHGVEAWSEATRERIEGARVFGELPDDLVEYAGEYIAVPLALPDRLIGAELTIEHVRRYAVK